MFLSRIRETNRNVLFFNCFSGLKVFTVFFLVNSAYINFMATVRSASQVGKEHFTPSLSQNRTLWSPIIWLLLFLKLCSMKTMLPIYKNIGIIYGYKPHPISCFKNTSESFMLLYHPFNTAPIEV